MLLTANDFNNLYPVGTKVTYYFNLRDYIKTKTREPACESWGTTIKLVGFSCPIQLKYIQVR